MVITNIKNVISEYYSKLRTSKIMFDSGLTCKHFYYVGQSCWQLKLMLQICKYITSKLVSKCVLTIQFQLCYIKNHVLNGFWMCNVFIMLQVYITFTFPCVVPRNWNGNQIEMAIISGSMVVDDVNSMACPFSGKTVFYLSSLCIYIYVCHVMSCQCNVM